MAKICKDFNENDRHQCSQYSKEDEASGADAVDVKAKLSDLQAKLEAQKDLYLRALADLDNFKKRMQKDREEIRITMTSAIIEDLLLVLDHFDLGLQSAKNYGAEEIVAGFSMVFEQLKRILASYGLNEVVPLHQSFNPHEQECVRREYVENLQEDTVTCVVRKGYKLNDRLIRPATVIVSTKQGAEAHG
ncbi:MAG: nucleotide exchange factor GrpE [Puniceicoccales bacterium]|jgi:molecular chaperone GrpE|nr:nucleotide exchange factor GrpE [Puniceicoccales bacterium]